MYRCIKSSIEDSYGDHYLDMYEDEDGRLWDVYTYRGYYIWISSNKDNSNIVDLEVVLPSEDGILYEGTDFTSGNDARLKAKDVIDVYEGVE